MATSPTINIVKSADSQQAPTKRRNRSRSLGGKAVVTLRGPVAAQIPWRVVILNSVLVAVILCLSIWALMQGDREYSAFQVIDTLLGGGTRSSRIFVPLRAARIVAALLVGAALGLSGAIFQVISGNTLGSPDIIGFTNGAATGALLQIIVFNSGPVEVAAGAVIGGLATSLLVWLMTRHTGLRGFRLVLVGIGVGSTLAALNSLLVVRASLTQAQTAASWLAGSLNDIVWERSFALMIAMALVVPALLLVTRPLGAIRFGDNVAAGLGVSVWQPCLLVCCWFLWRPPPPARSRSWRWPPRILPRPSPKQPGWGSPVLRSWGRCWCLART